MSDYIVKDTELTFVANAIRTKGGTNSQLVFPNGFVSAIGNISGGGGSSDFSTAEVTIIVDAAGGGGLNGGIANLSEGYGFLKNGSIVTMAGAAAGETINVTAILIEGEAIYNIVGGIVGNTTGGVSYDPENDTVKVIGDGSITITFDQ